MRRQVWVPGFSNQAAVQLVELSDPVAEFEALDFLVADAELAEVDLVPLSADGSGCLGVGALAAECELEGLFERFAHGRGLEFGFGEAAVGLGALFGDAILLLAKEVERDGSGVVGVEQLLALGGERGDPPALPLDLLGVGLLPFGQVEVEALADSCGLFLGELQAAVGVAWDGVLDDRGLDVGLRAAVAALAAGAEEVEVGAAVAVGLGDQQAGLAAGAVDGSLEVVVVLAVPLAGGGVGR